MKLSAILGINIADKRVILVGKPELTSYKSRENEPYYVCKTKTPVLVTCSSDSNIIPHDTDEVYLRESALELEGWKMVDEAKPEEGFFMEGWVVDFSKNRGFAILQETTVLEWTKGNNKQRGLDRTGKINQGLKDKIAARGAGK